MITYSIPHNYTIIKIYTKTFVRYWIRYQNFYISRKFKRLWRKFTKFESFVLSILLEFFQKVAGYAILKLGLPLLIDNNIDAYFCGHDHNMQVFQHNRLAHYHSGMGVKFNPRQSVNFLRMWKFRGSCDVCHFYNSHSRENVDNPNIPPNASKFWTVFQKVRFFSKTSTGCCQNISGLNCWDQPL